MTKRLTTSLFWKSGIRWLRERKRRMWLKKWKKKKIWWQGIHCGNVPRDKEQQDRKTKRSVNRCQDKWKGGGRHDNLNNLMGTGSE